MTNLLPCPFCGSKPTIFQGELYEIQCRECWRAGTWLCNTEAEAIEAWNTRTAAPSVVIETQELHNLKDECLREVAGIVRCKDCKWFDEVHQEPPLCYAPGMCQHEAQPDGFCAWGELREGSE